MWWIPLISAALLFAQSSGKQPLKQPGDEPRQADAAGAHKAADQKTDQKYAEPEEEDEGLKPSQDYVFNPLEAQYCLKIGNEYYSRKKYRPAILRFREAAKWNPGYAEAYLRLAQASEKINDDAGARKAYAKYLEVSPNAKDAGKIKKKIASLGN